MKIIKHCLRFTLLVVAILFFCLNPIEGQENIFVIHELGSKQGLTDNRYNYYIHQDPSGLVWVSSIAGLNRFDGRHIKTYLPNRTDSQSIHSVYVSSSRFYDTPDGNLWFTEDEAVIKYNRQDDNFERYYAINNDNTPIQTSYNWAYLDQTNGLLWFRTKIDNQSFLYTCNTRQEGHPIQQISPLNTTINDKMIRTDDGANQIFSIQGNKLHIHTLDTSRLLTSKKITRPEDIKLHGILPIDQNTCWVATSKGLYHLTLNTQEWQPHIGKYQDQLVDDIQDIAYWRPDCLLLATSNNGIFFYNPLAKTYTGKIQRFNNGQVESFSPNIDYIHLDSSKNLWISSEDAGVFYTNLCKPKFDLQLVGQAAIAMTGRQNSLIVLGLENVFHFENGKISSTPVPTQNGSLAKVKCIFQDKNDRLWLGTKSSLYYKNPEESSFKLFDQFPEDISPQHFLTITDLPNGDLLLGNVTAPSIRIQLNNLNASIFKPTLKQETTFIKYLDGYLLTYNHDNHFKVFSYNNHEFSLDTTLHPLSIINQIASDSTRSCFWLATDNGLYKLSLHQVSSWNLELQTTLKEKVISSLLIDDNGKIWMGTPRGLLEYQPDTGQQHLYNDSDLLQDYHFYRTSAWKSEEGTFFFGGANGVNHFKPSAIHSSITTAKPLVVDILINQESGIAHQFSDSEVQNPQFIKTLDLPFRKNNLTLHLSAGEYSDPEECYFIYQLAGANQAADTLNNRVLRFNNLSQGKYTLQIWAVNADGKRSPNAHNLAIVVRPPFHRSPLAFLIYGVVFFGLGYSFYNYRSRQITRQQQLEQKIIKANILAAKTEIAVLRLQMNPHFIFNSLVAIKSLVSNNEHKAAQAFLSHFSKLMRKILSESEKQLNSLEEEVELLSNYLALEQLRFPDQMTYSFHIDPNLDTYETMLPTMVLQPFIENAIIHGIRNKPTPGHIQINFLAADDDYLRCEVRDNGIGRGAQQKNASHQSKATDITRRRLAVLTSSMKLASSPKFEISDEFNEDGTPAGTTISFLFPPFY